MHLSVRARIALVVAAVTVVNVMAAAVSMSLYARASESAARAQQAQHRAALIAYASQRATELYAQAGDLALAVSGGSESAEQSARYGGLLGADAAVRHALDLVQRSGGSASLGPEYDRLRQLMYRWVNAEAARGGSSLRLVLESDGRVRATVVAATAGTAEAVPGVSLRGQVRRAQEAFRDATLRGLAVKADQDAVTAVAQEADAREAAQRATLLALVFALMVAIGSGVWLYGSIARPLARARDFAAAVEAGDLTVRYGDHRHDEIGELTHAVEEMKDAVVRRIDTMREVAGVVMVMTEATKESTEQAEALLDSNDAEPGALRSSVRDARSSAEALSGMVAELLNA